MSLLSCLLFPHPQSGSHSRIKLFHSCPHTHPIFNSTENIFIKLYIRICYKLSTKLYVYLRFSLYNNPIIYRINKWIEICRMEIHPNFHQPIYLYFLWSLWFGYNNFILFDSSKSYTHTTHSKCYCCWLWLHVKL